MAGVTASGIASDIVPVTPDNNADLVDAAFALRISPTGSAGNVRVVTSRGQTRNIEMRVGEVLPVQVTRILLTGTTANGIEALIP